MGWRHPRNRDWAPRDEAGKPRQSPQNPKGVLRAAAAVSAQAGTAEQWRGAETLKSRPSGPGFEGRRPRNGGAPVRGDDTAEKVKLELKNPAVPGFARVRQGF